MSASLKRLAQDVANDGNEEQSENIKRVKLDGESNGDNSCNDGAKENEDES